MNEMYIHDVTGTNALIQVVTLGDNLDAYRNVEAYVVLLRKLGHGSTWYSTREIFRMGDEITVKIGGDVIQGRLSKIENSCVWINTGYQNDNKAIVERMIDIIDLNDASISR